ncbi:hypothetical protein [Streptomyces sp. B21-083]|uniref:hypothetical protein n=1 Tax=Streptomyces sp. B21-083 TaxID=3039410 RepID=UPI002FF2BFC2
MAGAAVRWTTGVDGIAEAWDGSTRLTGELVGAFETVDGCTAAESDVPDAGDAGPCPGDTAPGRPAVADDIAGGTVDDGTEPPAAATGPVEPTPDTAGVVGEPADAELSPDGVATCLVGTAVDLAEAADLCTAAVSVIAGTGRDTAADPDAPGANWPDAAPEPEEAAVGRTGGVADGVEPTGEVEEARGCSDASEAGAPGTTPREMGATATASTAGGAPGATVPVAPPELPVAAAVVFLATGKVRRCTTAAPETLVSGATPDTGEATAAAEPPAPAAPPEATGATPAAEADAEPEDDDLPTAATRGPAARATAPGNATR